jgi:tRNA threonylcarbamoyl adenosine modification protein (Sua5/YciO/YrdC/YwlC family)
MGFNVALPTETVYGLFAVFWNASAVEGIYKKKGRSTTNPLIIHASGIEDVYKYDITRMTKKEEIIFHILADNFWPGPFTVVVRANVEKVNPMIRNNSEFVAIRVPMYELLRKILRLVGLCVGPSANRSGKISPTDPKHVSDDYDSLSIFMPILKSCRHSTMKQFGLESTIVQIVETENVVKIKMLRPGAIGTEQISDCLARHHIDFQYDIDVNIDCVNHTTAVAPGQEITHYAPDTETFLGTSTGETAVRREDAVLLATKAILYEHGSKYKECFVLPSTDEECASVLYDIMRKADAYCRKHHISTIVICEERLMVDNPKAGTASAIHEKLVRATSGAPSVRV